jgi:hypothetical protein
MAMGRRDLKRCALALTLQKIAAQAIEVIGA